MQRLSLLKTCRQIYIEAVPVLYSTWKFYLRDMDTLIHLSETLLPQRLATIRTLHITVPVCFNHEPYGTLESGWKIIATKMTGLRDFGVTWLYYVCDNHPSDLSGWDISRERKYLEPLLEIRGLDIFYLEYDPYDVPDDDEDEDPIDVSAEAMAFKAHLKEVMCTRSKQTPYGGDGATLAVDGP